jgi:hypothetical protein
MAQGSCASASESSLVDSQLTPNSEQGQIDVEMTSISETVLDHNQEDESGSYPCGQSSFFFLKLITRTFQRNSYPQ